MARLAEVLKRKVDALKLRMDRASGVFEVVTVSPFTVYLDGIEEPMPAIALVGASYSVGTKGRYFLDQGQLPLCLPTTATP